ncbi:reverse transcriptase N-terminal domain-containing protein, partial [Streptomyces sp. NPDC005799]|uniref:reverse transcriptase N-terminal domain-containing protein n=1 Tax=Streptomyces sp. NPDC005799 TaxID=3154678 RepID=UPI0033F29E06
MNGPEDVAEWDDIAWRHHEDNVVRLRQRIFKATREEDWALVRSLQKLMLRSWSNTLISVRQVTQCVVANRISFEVCGAGDHLDRGAGAAAGMKER